MTVLDRVVVVGASLAGLRAVETLRGEGYGGEIVLVGAESGPPYDRPPLSKKLLRGEWEPERIILRGDDAFAELAVTERFGTEAIGLDVEAREVIVADGDRIGFDALIIATGSRPRMLPGQPPSVRMLRDLDDALALRGDLAGGSRRVVIVGAGFIGLEVAASARMLGNEVTVVEVAPVPLGRVLGDLVGPAIASIHADAGTDVRCGVYVTGIDESGVDLAGGERLPADVVIVGIGAEPVVDWLAKSGLTLDNGIVVDASLSAGPKLIYAAGDVAHWPNGQFDGEMMRLEHWTNAAEQGAHAARNLLAEASGEAATAYEAVPFVWSDQYAHRIQYVGHSSATDRCEIVAGSIEDRSFVALYSRAGRLRAAAGLDQPRLVMPYRRLIAERADYAAAVELATTQRAALAARDTRSAQRN